MPHRYPGARVPAFITLMAASFDSDPFAVLVCNDEVVRELPDWLVLEMTREMTGAAED